MAEEAREFTEAILGAAHAVLSEARRIPRRLGWCGRPAVRAALLAALDKKREARRQCKTKHTTATWEALRAACKEVRAAIDKGIEVHLEEYVADLETLLRHSDMRGLHKHLKMTAGLGGRKTEGQQAIKDENGICCEIRGTSSGGGRGSSAICSSLPHSNHPSSRRYSSGGRYRRRRGPEHGRKSGSQYHSMQSQRTRRRSRQSGRWQTGKRRALTHSQESYSNWTTPPANLSSSSISTPFSSVCGEGRKSRRSGKTQRPRCFTRSRTDPTATTSEGFHSSPTPATYC